MLKQELIYSLPIPTTAEAQAEELARFILIKMNAELARVLETMDICFASVFKNKYELPPQKVLNAFGTNAGRLFEIMGAMQTAMNVAKPGCATQTPPDHTINQDGTVTITS